MNERLRFLRHIGLPALLGFGLLGLYYVPKDLFGCVNRGLLALGIMLASMLGAMVCMVLAVRFRSIDLTASRLWLLSAVFLLLPSLLVAAIEVSIAG